MRLTIEAFGRVLDISYSKPAGSTDEEERDHLGGSFDPAPAWCGDDETTGRGYDEQFGLRAKGPQT